MVINEKYIGLVAAVIGATLWYLALRLPNIPTHGDVGPAFFPKIIAAMLFACAAFFMVQGLRNRGPQQRSASWDLATVVKITSLLAVTAAYVALMVHLGFVIATCAYLVVGGYIFGDRRWALLCISGVLTSTALYAVFKMWLKVPLPLWNSFMDAFGE